MVQFIEEHIDKEGQLTLFVIYIHALFILHAGGPYLIGLNDGNVFLSVTDDYVVGATTDIEDAAAFYISQPEAEGDEPVLISYYKKAVIGEHAAKLKVHKIARWWL